MSDKTRYTTEAGERRFSLYIYADAETKEALYQLAVQQGRSQSQVVCGLIKGALSKMQSGEHFKVGEHRTVRRAGK